MSAMISSMWSSAFLRAEQDVLALFRFRQVELRALRDDLFAERDEVFEERLERKRLRHAVDERDDVVVEGLFELRVLVEIVEDGLRVRVVLELDDDADVLGALVAQVADAFELLFVHQVGDFCEKVDFVDAERDGSDDDLVVALFALDNFGVAAHDDTARDRSRTHARCLFD